MSGLCCPKAATLKKTNAKDNAKDNASDTRGVLSNRGLEWDAHGRLRRVRGVKDSIEPGNQAKLNEEYVYDHDGNRVVKIHRPLIQAPTEGSAAPLERATLYLTPYYARPANGRGVVQLASSNFPTASLSPPLNKNADPIVSYLYSDLPVGSSNASVMAFGELDSADTLVISRREYSPMGLELTPDDWAKPERSKTPHLSSYHAKELDSVTAFSSFGARYYSRDMGIWLTPDPMLHAYMFGGRNNGIYASKNVPGYLFAGANPISTTDMDGNIVCGGACIAGAITLAGWAWTASDGYSAYQKDGIAGVAKVGATEAAATLVGGVAGKVLYKGYKAAKSSSRLAKIADDAVAFAKRVARDETGSVGIVSNVRNSTLRNGDALSTDDALNAAIDHLGPNYKEIAPGVFKSADGKRMLRMTDSDLSKVNNHAGAPHMNFETGTTVIKPNGRERFVPNSGADGNKHIFLPEEK